MAANSRCSAAGYFSSSRRSRDRSAFSVSDWECTETYSPAAIDMAPATRPATPVTTICAWLAPDAAIPTTRLEVETMPSLAPSPAARSQPMRPMRCPSLWRRGGFMQARGKLPYSQAILSDPCRCARGCIGTENDVENDVGIPEQRIAIGDEGDVFVR